MPVMALTATASNTTIKEIQAALSVRDSLVVKAPMLRTNLHLSVHRRATAMAHAQLYDLLASSKKLTVVYCNKKEACETLAAVMGSSLKNCAVGVFHGGLDSSVRDDVLARCQDARLHVLFCTVAFGMGINLAVRSVIHWDVPHSMSTYVQEIGRAGRDGQPAECVMLVKDDWYEQACMRFTRTPNTLETNTELARVVREYCCTDTCRHVFILQHFHAVDELCACGSNCDVCMRARTCL